MDIFKNNMNKRDKGSKKTETHMGTYEDMLKSKAEKLPEIQKEIQKLFENYDGGGVCIVMNTYDENGDVEGAHVAIMGVDKPGGLIRLAKSVHMASEEIVDNLQQNGNVGVLAEAVMEMLKDLTKGK